MRALTIRRLNHRHICSVRGCGNRDTVMTARSADLAGGIFICADCVKELYDHYFPHTDVDEVDVSAEEVETTSEGTTAEDSAEKPAQATRKRSKAKE